MKPTVIPQGDVAAASIPEVPRAVVPAAPLNTGAIVVRPDQVAQVDQALASLDFPTLPAADIIKLGFGAEQALQQTLDGFLARLDKNTASKVFVLFERLEKGVEDANLSEVLEKIQNGDKPGFFAGLFAKMTGKEPDEVVREFIEEVRDLVTGRTKTLADEMQRLERELTKQMQTLFGELQVLETLKQSYVTHFGNFTVDAAVARAFLDKAKTYVAKEQTSLNPSDVVAQTKLRELEDKLQLLQSRALALEGTYTRLPADQKVIQQIQQAGIATLQETATTIASRFTSIKMTLLSLHGAFAVKSVQQLSERQARMDEQLTKLRGEALKDVAVTAARAPGDNRLAQAQQIEAIIASTREIHVLVAEAKAETEEKFEQARQRFAQARSELAQLSSR